MVGGSSLWLNARGFVVRDVVEDGVELSSAIFDWIEAFYNRVRRHSALGMLSPIAYEKLHNQHTSAA